MKKSAHGVRKIGATRAAENGATVAELEALFGWRGGGMAALYTRAADRSRLAQRAMSKMQRTTEEQSIGSPDEKVSEKEKVASPLEPATKFNDRLGMVISRVASVLRVRVWRWRRLPQLQRWR